jgi:hypothetical protein
MLIAKLVFRSGGFVDFQNDQTVIQNDQTDV